MTHPKKRKVPPALTVVERTPSLPTPASEPAPPANPFTDTLARMQRTVAERQAKEEAAKVYQLPLWADDKRAMPTDFLTSALFAAIHPKDATYLEDVELANINGFRVTFRGQRLTQVDVDVWQGIMHLARQFPEGSKVRFSARQFLRLIGRHTGKSQRQELRRIFSTLCATCVDIHDTRNKQRFWGSLLPNGAAHDEDDDTLFVLQINRELARVFDLGHVAIDWQVRTKLKAKPLQLWLQLYFATSTKPIAVANLHRLSGSKAELKEFRRKLRVALAELAEEGGHAAHIDANDVVQSSKRLGGGASEPPEGGGIRATRNEGPTPIQKVLPSLGLPVVTPRALERFGVKYPDHDGKACLADWLKWTGSRKATNPDAAFLGFAKKWVTLRS
jgi:hypothetical protein